jgi:hypothetical protein
LAGEFLASEFLDFGAGTTAVVIRCPRADTDRQERHRALQDPPPVVLNLMNRIADELD